MTRCPNIAEIRTSCPLFRKVAAGVMLALLPLSSVWAQSGQDESHPALEVTISDVASAGRLINIAVNKSVVVNFNIPVRLARVAKSEIAEVAASSPTQLIITGKSFGVTQLIVWSNEEHQNIFDVAVNIELERLQASIRTIAPRARVKAHAVMDSVVLSGIVPDSTTAESIMQIADIYSPRVLNQMRVAGTQQVMLRCTVAEVNRSATRQIGFNGWAAGDHFRDMFAISNINGINPSSIGAPEGASVTASIPFLIGQNGIPVTGSPTLSFGFPRAQMQLFVQALREDGLLRVLAEPNVVAISGQEATFLVGGEFPIPVPQRDSAITISYRKFGIQLTFTPTVISEDIIRLKIAAEVSEPDLSNAVSFGGFTVPGLAQRIVKTVVELGNGQTFAIGGLLSERVRGITRKVPGLGDIPVLGQLFSSSEYQTDQTELVILVTPELVEGVSSEQVTYIPGSTMLQPNDFEFFLLGKLDGMPGEGAPILTPRVHHEWPARPADVYGGSQDLSLKLRGPLGPAGYEEGM